MLEAIRNRSKGPIAKIVLGLIIIPFAFTGVYSYFNAGGANVVATVNDSEIDLREFEQAYRMQQQNWGENFDRFFNTDERIQQFRMNVLQQLINQRLSSQAIQEMGVRASDDELRQEIMSNPQFQDESGNFDHDRYQLLVESAGYTVEQYQAARKADMSSQQFFKALADTNFALEYELQNHQVLEGQTRNIDFIVIPKQRFIETADFSSDEAKQEIQAYYDTNQSQFQVPEKVAVEYILLSKADFMDVEITDEEVAGYYQDNIDAYEGTERRRVAHILVNVPTDADATAIQAAEAKIAEAKAAIEAGEAFEAVVSKYSEDTLSADMGGDLDWIEKDMMDSAFEDAAFALQEKGSLSDIVRSEFGFHLIKLLDLETASAKPLSEVKDQIIADLKANLAEDNFLEAKDLLAERAFEYADSLKEAAEAVNTEVNSTALFDQQLGIGLDQELRSEPLFISTAFSDEVLLDELNSELIELSDDRAVVLRKLDYQEAGIRPLEEVTAMIQQILTNEKAETKTAEATAKVISQLNEGFTLDMVASGLDSALADITWSNQAALTRSGTEVDSNIRDYAFKMNIESAVESISLPTGDMAIVKLNAINRPMADSSVAATHADKFIQYHQQSELSGYLKYLDTHASISRNLSNAEVIQ